MLFEQRYIIKSRHRGRGTCSRALQMHVMLQLLHADSRESFTGGNLNIGCLLATEAGKQTSLEQTDFSHLARTVYNPGARK